MATDDPELPEDPFDDDDHQRIADEVRAELEAELGLSPDEAARLAVTAKAKMERAGYTPGHALLDNGGKDALGHAARAVVADIAVKILAGDIEITKPAHARDVAKVFFDIARLEAGEATSRTETVTREDRMAEIEALREQARQRAGADLRLVEPPDQESG